jgi:signal transduction histidine kinase
LQKDPERPVVSEIETVKKSGIKVWIAWTYKPIFDDDDDFIAILCIGNDITELKRSSQEKEELHAQLQRAQKMEAIGTLAGGVAHDLNNILSGIVSYPELLLMDLEADSPLKKPILTIQKSGEKAAAIVQDLLTLARRGVEATEVVNLNDIILDYLTSPEHEKLELNHPNITVKKNLDENLLNILGSPVHLSKTVMNLISNSAEAMSEGGNIRIATENRHVDTIKFGYDDINQGDYAALTVTDSGIGIPPEDIERIFEPFYTKKIMGRSGTGLGMAVVWGTVKDHRGYIDLTSTEGKGTEVNLYFPVTRKAISPQVEMTSIQDLKGKGESILVVDDIEEQRQIATEMLEKLDYTVTTVSTGEEAVEYLRHHTVDLLVLDMIMEPGIDGFETYRRIIELRPDQKAIIASGFSETIRVKETQNLGAGAYIKKPYLLEKIGRAIKAELIK